MCNPLFTTIGTAVGATTNAAAVGAATLLGGASSVLQIIGQRNQAKTQRKVQENASKVERQRYLNEVSSLRTQQAQEAEAIAQKLQANKTKAMKAQATARLAALEAGVAGISVDALKQDLTRKEALYNQSLGKQSQMLDVR